jgi:hypothetical protein
MAPDDKIKPPVIRKKDLNKKFRPDENLPSHGQPEFHLEEQQPDLGSPVLEPPDPSDHQQGNR